jgi:hypothetical protein
VVIIDGQCFSVAALDILFCLKKNNILDFFFFNFPPLEPKLLVIWEGIGEAFQIVCKVLHTV